jgi:hypothetical protein
VNRSKNRVKVTSHPPLILGFPDYREQAQRLASAAGLDYAEVEIHHFPDGESRVRLPAGLGERVILCRSLDHPNDKLIELALTATAARELGARHLTLVAPYLCYMRQDKAFRPGEAISQPIIGQLLADWVEELITVDPHLHRVPRLEDAIPVQRAHCLTAAPLMADFLARELENPLLIGPDEEAASGSPPSPPTPVSTTGSAPKSGTATGRSRSIFQTRRPPGVIWCWWTMSPAPVTPWSRPSPPWHPPGPRPSPYSSPTPSFWTVPWSACARPG